MKSTSQVIVALTFGLVAPSHVLAQINFEKSDYYLALGDSVRPVKALQVPVALRHSVIAREFEKVWIGLQ